MIPLYIRTPLDLSSSPWIGMCKPRYRFRSFNPSIYAWLPSGHIYTGPRFFPSFMDIMPTVYVALFVQDKCISTKLMFFQMYDTNIRTLESWKVDLEGIFIYCKGFLWFSIGVFFTQRCAKVSRHEVPLGLEVISEENKAFLDRITTAHTKIMLEECLCL